MSGTNAISATPLKAAHESLGGRMAPFAGWLMPIQYPSGILREHLHTRTAASVFDTCHMSQFMVRGVSAPEALDRLLARPASNQKIGTCRYNFLMNETGGIRDDLVVYRMALDEFFIVGNAGTRGKDADWFRRALKPSVTFEDISNEIGKIDLQGPASADVLEGLGLKQTGLPGYFRWIKIQLLGDEILISRTGYTGELGFELYVPWEKTGLFWEALLADKRVMPAGLGARDTLRLEAGLPLYGQDIDEQMTPVEAGFGGMIDLARDFIGRDGAASPPRFRLLGLAMDGRRAARHGMRVYCAGGVAIGEVTSGAFAPSLGHAVAMARIDAGAGHEENTAVGVGEPDKLITGRIVSLPFHTSGTARINIINDAR